MDPVPISSTLTILADLTRNSEGVLGVLDRRLDGVSEGDLSGTIERAKGGVDAGDWAEIRSALDGLSEASAFYRGSTGEKHDAAKSVPTTGFKAFYHCDADITKETELVEALNLYSLPELGKLACCKELGVADNELEPMHEGLRDAISARDEALRPRRRTTSTTATGARSSTSTSGATTWARRLSRGSSRPDWGARSITGRGRCRPYVAWTARSRGALSVLRHSAHGLRTALGPDAVHGEAEGQRLGLGRVELRRGGSRLSGIGPSYAPQPLYWAGGVVITYSAIYIVCAVLSSVIKDASDPGEQGNVTAEHATVASGSG